MAIDGETMETVTDYLQRWGASKSLQMVTAAMKLKDTSSLEEKYDQPRQHIKMQRHYFANKGPSSQGYILSPCLFNLYAEFIMRMLSWMKHKLEPRLPGEISVTSDKQRTPSL